MSNTGEYYDHLTYPATGAAGSSAAMRAELDSIEAGLNKLPSMAANGGKLVKVAASADNLEVSAVISDNGTDATISGDLIVSGTQIGQNTTQKHIIPAVASDTLALLAAVQTLTNKIIVAASNTITTAASGNLTATELNAALAELQTDIDTRATIVALAAKQDLDATLTALAALNATAGVVEQTGADAFTKRAIGTGANEIVALGADSKLPAVDGSNLTGVIATPADGSITTAKLADGVFNGLTTVTLASTDKIAIADSSDLGNKKVALASDITAIIAAASLTAAGKVELATDAEIRTGTDGTRAMPVDQFLSAMGITSHYSSGNQTITSAGLLNLAHGLPRTPSLVCCWLVCTTNDGGFIVGDKILASSLDNSSSGADNFGHVLAVDATNIRVRFGTAAAVYITLNIGTGAPQALVNASWRLVVEAWA